MSFKGGSTQDIKAGQGATVALGGYFKPEESSPFSVRATVGYKFVTTAASNADIGIDRIVYELVGNWAASASRSPGVSDQRCTAAPNIDSIAPHCSMATRHGRALR